VTDDRLREAERVYRESGDVSAEARLLRERARAGTLAPERLELAAELGYEGARAALDLPARRNSHSLRDVVRGLERFGQEVVVRAALVVARRCVAVDDALPATGACFTALEAWLVCPCDEHRDALAPFARRETHHAARLAVLAAQGVGRYVPGRIRQDRHYEPDAVLVGAIRGELVRWALRGHEPRFDRGARVGQILDLLAGCSESDVTTRLLVDAASIRVGAGAWNGIQIDRGHGCDARIVRTEQGFEVRDVTPPRGFVNERRVERSALATGDVVSLGDNWFEVRILSQPFEEEIERARGAAAMMMSHVEEAHERRRVEIAAAAGHLGAVLAASMAGIRLQPRFTNHAWLASLGLLPHPVDRIALVRLAREVAPAWSRVFPHETAFDRALAALERWVERAPDDRLVGPETLIDELGLALQRGHASTGDAARATGIGPMRRRPSHRHALGAGSLVYEVLGLTSPDVTLRRVADHATAAGLSPARVRAIVSDELLRWALGGETGTP
jgi:hypothetical protein